MYILIFLIFLSCCGLGYFVFQKYIEVTEEIEELYDLYYEINSSIDNLVGCSNSTIVKKNSVLKFKKEG